MKNQTIIQKLIDLATRYDRFTGYIDNYSQQLQAEKRNEEIESEFIQTAAELGVNVSGMDFHQVTNATGTVYSKLTVEEAVLNLLEEKGFNNNNKEESLMETTSNTTTNTNAQEDTVMLNKEEIMNTAATLYNAMLNDEEVNVEDVRPFIELGRIDNPNNALRISKDEMVKFGQKVGMKTNAKTTRKAVCEYLDKIINEYRDRHSIPREEVPAPANPNKPVTIASPVPVVDNTSAQPVNNTSAKAKTDKLFALIKACANDNKSKGFGYTISSYMLQACILNAGAGIPKMKGHTVTPEENKMTQEIYSWLKSKGFIKPVVYSVQEDEKVRIYTPDYPGKTDTKHVTMIPYAKSKGYTAKKVTSFLVTI